MSVVSSVVGLSLLFLAGLIAFVRWGTRWGSTEAERRRSMVGDSYYGDSQAPRVVMTRAISISQSPKVVWPWLAQLGRGAGWYSVEALDNGRKTSAQHIVSWIPDPQAGDATAIGYLRHIDPGKELVWWVPGVPFFGAMSRLVVDILLQPASEGSRLVIRMSGDATGAMAWPALWVFELIDTIMARRQLLQIKKRVEAFQARTSDPEEPETGARDQYQQYEVIYASGDTAGVAGIEHAKRWRQTAIDAGILPPLT